MKSVCGNQPNWKRNLLSLEVFDAIHPNVREADETSPSKVGWKTAIVCSLTPLEAVEALITQHGPL